MSEKPIAERIREIANYWSLTAPEAMRPKWEEMKAIASEIEAKAEEMRAISDEGLDWSFFAVPVETEKEPG